MSIKLIQDETFNILVPKQIHVLLLANGQFKHENGKYEVVLQLEKPEDVISYSVEEALVPGVSEQDIRALLNDAIFREYTVQYNSARRLLT